MKSTKLKQIILGGEIMTDYFIEYTNNEVRVWSKKHGKLKRLSIPKSGSASYPGFSFMINGIKVRADVHRVVAENLLPFPKPQCFTKGVWNSTPDTVKQHIKSLYFVNHIDHDKYNCDITNLEWVTSKGNAHAYHAHKKAMA